MVTIARESDSGDWVLYYPYESTIPEVCRGVIIRNSRCWITDLTYEGFNKTRPAKNIDMHNPLVANAIKGTLEYRLTTETAKAFLHQEDVHVNIKHTTKRSKREAD